MPVEEVQHSIGEDADRRIGRGVRWRWAEVVCKDVSIVARHYTHVNSDRRALKIFYFQTSCAKRLVNCFQEQSILRIDAICFIRGDIEKPTVKSACTLRDEVWVLDVCASMIGTIGMKKGICVKSLFGYPGEEISQLLEKLPKPWGVVGTSWKMAATANEGDRLAASTIVGWYSHWKHKIQISREAVRPRTLKFRGSLLISSTERTGGDFCV
jgi:hypothetical protein